MIEIDPRTANESLDGIVGAPGAFPTQIPSTSVVVDMQQLETLREVVVHHRVKQHRKYIALAIAGVGLVMLVVGMNISTPVAPKAQAQVLGVSSVSSSKSTSSSASTAVSKSSSIVSSSVQSSVISKSQQASSSSSVSIQSFVTQSSVSTQSQVIESSLYFASCTQAKAAGYHNIQVGEPGYRPALDRDKDGVACEN